MAKRKVMMDAGHGGHDGGAVNKTREKDEVLPLTLDVGKRLQDHGVEVGYTRTTDVFIPLRDRATKSNNFGADLFVSIHFNSAANKTALGTETFHHRGSNNGKVAAGHVFNEMKRRDTSLAYRGVKPAGFYVLKNTKARAILVEVAFISNEKDMKHYKNNYQKHVEAITKGILDNLGITYKPKEVNVPKLPEPKPTTPTTSMLFFTEPVEVPGGIVNGKTYVDIDTAYVTNTVLTGEGKPKVEKNIKLGLVEILRAIGLYADWSEEDRMVIVGLAKGLKPEEEDNLITINVMGNDVIVRAIKVKGKYYLIVENYAIQLRGFFEKIGLNVDYNKEEDKVYVRA